MDLIELLLLESNFLFSRFLSSNDFQATERRTAYKKSLRYVRSNFGELRKLMTFEWMQSMCMWYFLEWNTIKFKNSLAAGKISLLVKSNDNFMCETSAVTKKIALLAICAQKIYFNQRKTLLITKCTVSIQKSIRLVRKF